MPVVFCKGDLFLSGAQTLAHGCNCRGVMGAGIAVAFKKRFLDMFERYKHVCTFGEFTPGKAYVDKKCTPWVLNLATQWAFSGAELKFIKQTFQWIADKYQEEEITSIAMPQIGAGYGGLNWHSVKELITDILHPLPIPIYVYEKFVLGVKGDWE